MSDTNNNDLEVSSIIYGVVVEESATHRVRCEYRDGVKVFVFDDGHYKKVVVPVEEYIEILEKAQSNTSESAYGIPNKELV